MCEGSEKMWLKDEKSVNMYVAVRVRILRL